MVLNLIILQGLKVHLYNWIGCNIGFNSKNVSFCEKFSKNSQRRLTFERALHNGLKALINGSANFVG